MFTQKQIFNDKTARILLILMILVFSIYSIFIALNIKRGLVPDETGHYAFSKYFATTWGIPQDSDMTYTSGWYIEQNPFLFYWINGRIINAVTFFFPTITDWQQLIILRFSCVIYSIITLLFCYRLSYEILKDKRWSLIPVFLLSNTIMFVYLSGGVNYDNLANMFSMASLFFLARILLKKDYWGNIFGWLICVGLGTLVKYPILPLAVISGIILVVFSVHNRKSIDSIRLTVKRILLIPLVIFVIYGNIAIYGVNLFRYQSIIPQCSDILPSDICAKNPFYIRLVETGLDEKLTVQEAITQGYPDPIGYFFSTWIPNMLQRIYGILGAYCYFPAHIIIYYQILFYWILMISIKFCDRPSLLTISMIIITLFYAFILFITNLDSEYAYGFKQIALQGRYIFPVIGFIYILLTTAIKQVKNKPIMYITLGILIILFFIGGPIKFILRYDTSFGGWFI